MAGVNVPGASRPAWLLAELCMGGLGHVEFASLIIGGEAWPGVNYGPIIRPSPAWRRSTPGGRSTRKDFLAMGSGPLRAQGARGTRAVRPARYAESATRGVLVLEGRALPTDSVVTWVAAKAGLAPTH